MSEGPLFFIFTRDFQNVDRRHSETKELMSKKNNAARALKNLYFS